MASITFANGTIIPASWLNDVNTATYSPLTTVFTAVAGQTVFTLPSTPKGLTKLYMNGLRLSPTTDYSVSGTAITLTSAASLGDELLVDY